MAIATCGDGGAGKLPRGAGETKGKKQSKETVRKAEGQGGSGGNQTHKNM